MKAVKKPVEIDFFLIEPSTASIEGKVMQWLSEFGDKFEDHFIAPADGYHGLKVKTLEGTSYDVTENDVIIRGIKGEYYPCRKDIFEETYDKIQ